MATKPFDPTLKALVETAPGDWLTLLDLPPAPVSVIDADVATVSSAAGIINQMEARLRRRAMRPWADDTWAATLILLGLRYPLDFAREMLRGVHSMKESVTYQAILEEGKALGEALAEVREARKILLRLGTKRFGSPDALTNAKLERLTDLEQIESLCDRLPDVDSWSTLLPGTKPTPSRRRRSNPN